MISPPCFIFVFHNNLAESGGKPVVIIVYHGLSDVQGCLAYQILQFLPATVGWNTLEE